MKHLFILLFSTIFVSLNAGYWMWGESIGGQHMERIWEMASDADDNLFVTGEFEENMQIGNQYIQGMGLTDTFLAKYNSDGVLQWCASLTSSEENAGLGLGVDAGGNSYVGGFFMDTLYCQGDSVVSNGMWDCYVAKFNPEGDLQWLRSFGGPLNDIIHGLAVTSYGQVFAAGWFADSITFTDAISLSSYGGSDVLALSLNSDGDLLWARQGGTISVDYGYKIACDEGGNAYVTGSASPSSNFDGILLPSGGVYVAKYDSQGNIQWLLPTQNAWVISIAVERNPGDYQRGAVAGRLMGSGAFGGYSFDTIDGSNDYYWAEFNAEWGEWVDLQVHGGAGDDRARDVNYGNTLGVGPLVVGTLSETANFMGMEYTSQGGDDIAIWHPVFGPIVEGGQNSEIPYAICELSDGRIAIAGWHWGMFSLGNGIILDSGNESNQNGFVAVYYPHSASVDLVQQAPALLCYPNPFVETLTTHNDKGRVGSLQVFNTKGQLVRKLDNAKGGDFLWDGKDARGQALSSGVYIIDLDGRRSKVLKLNH